MNKTSTAARRANRYGIQHHAGKPFVSYAYRDKLVHDRCAGTIDTSAGRCEYLDSLRVAGIRIGRAR